MMSRNRTVNCLTFAGLLALAGCAGGGATMVAPAPRLKVPAWAQTAPTLVAAAPRLKVPTWAQTPDPLSERKAARLIREHGARRSGEVALERDPSEVELLFGAFTRADAHEAIAAVRTGLLGRRAWQAWLLEWHETGWQAVRPITSNCTGRVEQARLERNGPATLLVRDSCGNFGRDEGQVRLIALGPSNDTVLFAANERSGGPEGGVRHSVWLTGFDENGQAEVVDLAFTESRGQVRAWTRAKITSAVTTYRPAGQGLVAVAPSEADTSERVAVLPSY